MPTKQYKDPRVCECGYETMIIANWSAHKKRCKGLGEAEQLKNQVAQMKEQLATNHEHYQKELAAKDEQMKDQREEIKMFEQLLAERFIELREELKQIRKRKQPTQRVHRTEPQRREIAKRQNWLCTGQQCREAKTTQELQEYDIDHIVPLYLGGTEEPDNLQALCPGCHRRKTDQERTDALMSTNVS
jgi:5-methylcytosine-specific restriction protein A